MAHQYNLVKVMVRGLASAPNRQISSIAASQPLQSAVTNMRQLDIQERALRFPRELPEKSIRHTRAKAIRDQHHSESMCAKKTTMNRTMSCPGDTFHLLRLIDRTLRSCIFS